MDTFWMILHDHFVGVLDMYKMVKGEAIGYSF